MQLHVNLDLTLNAHDQCTKFGDNMRICDYNLNLIWLLLTLAHSKGSCMSTIFSHKSTCLKKGGVQGLGFRVECAGVQGLGFKGAVCTFQVPTGSCPQKAFLFFLLVSLDPWLFLFQFPRERTEKKRRSFFILKKKVKRKENQFTNFFRVALVHICAIKKEKIRRKIKEKKNQSRKEVRKEGRREEKRV